MRQNAAGVFEIIARLDGIPADVPPVLRGLLPVRFKRYRAGVKRKLHLPPEVEVVDHIGSVLHACQKGDRAAVFKIHTEFYMVIFQPAHAFGMC